MTDPANSQATAREVFERFEEAYMRGHEDYIKVARQNEDYYLGGGRQWDPAVRQELENDGRPCYEVNQVLPAVNAATGFQIDNQVDISFVPRGGAADEKLAKLMSKVVRQQLDNAEWQDKETEVFLDGMIQQRGYFDIRMDYEQSDLGEVGITAPDPLDVVPDPDAKSYDTDAWGDVHYGRWLTEAQLEQNYGKDAAEEVVERSEWYTGGTSLFGGAHYGMMRAGFGERMPGFYGLHRGWIGEPGAWRRYRVVERQTNEFVNSLVARWPTGDIRVVEGLPREHIAWLLDHGVHVFKKRVRRVRWVTAAPEVAIYNKLSPYDHFTIVPFFPYFRRGRTVGMVDNLRSVQDMLNKFISQYGHVVNGSANGGWQGEAGVLKNMTDEEFLENGAQTGLTLLREPGAKPFEKIQPNQVPTGLDRMVEFANQHSRTVSGIDDALQGLSEKDLSGVAIQSLQFSSQKKLAIALKNLARTRRTVALRVLECVQKFMGAQRIMRIAEENAYGVKEHVPYALNVRQPDGSILNDLTAGRYDLVINQQPAQVTFDNSNFEQMKTMRVEMGIPISDARIVRASNLTDKSEIAEELAQQSTAQDPRADAEAALLHEQAALARATAVAKNIEAEFSAIKTAREIVLTPQAAEIADALLRSGGFKDADAAPIVPSAPEGMELPAAAAGEAENSHPLFPTNPDAGLEAGLASTTE